MSERSKLTKFSNLVRKVKKRGPRKLQAKAAYCTKEILKAKNDYLLRMTSELNDPKTAPKTYCSILNRFLYNKKIPSIPPLLVQNKFISNFRVKANILNDFFASVCTPINKSTLPQFAYKTDVKINSFRVVQNDISRIIKTLYAEKRHGWDKISINMMQICGDPIALPLMGVFEMALNVVPVHKKEENNLLKLSSY